MKKHNKTLFSKLILLVLLLFINIITNPVFPHITLKNKFEKAEIGDYIVTFENKSYSLLIIQNISQSENSSKIISLAEISIPQNRVNIDSFSWKKWAEGTMAGNSACNIYEIDLANAKVIKSYSFTKKCFFTSADQDMFFTKLLTLPLEKLTEGKRKKIGAPPLDDSLDTRALWNPPQIIDGIKQNKINFDVFQATWPKDGTDLSGKLIDIYFDKEGVIPFPYWIQVSNGNIEVMLKTIDSGKNLKFDKKIPK